MARHRARFVERCIASGLRLVRAPLTLRANRRFFADFARLSSEIAKKTDGVIRDLHAHGPRHEPFHMRKIEGNSDARFHYLNVDNKWRMVVALEGNVVFLEKVGNHDETLAWGAKASLDEYRERLEVGPEGIGLRKRAARPAAEEPVLFEGALTLPQIVDREEEVADLIVGDLGALTGYRDGLIEDWMVFLSPLQRRAVDRTVVGPGRVTGGPGTGKTVVGLHRAAAFARAHPDGRVLITSFVNTVPKVLEGLFERHAPDVCERVDFRSIHSLAGEILNDRGITVEVDEKAARKRFAERFRADAERHALLARAGLSEQYLWDESGRIIEGRRVGSLDEYLRLARHGRHKPLREEERRLMWAVYEEYRHACERSEPEVTDWSRHLALAADAVGAHTPEEIYEAIVVDEAQDITQAGIAMLVGMLRGGTKGQLLLIGDNAQRIYPGGFRLADLDLEVRGRSFLLSHCYRSTDEIMRAAGALGRFLSREEFGEDGVRDASLQTTRFGEVPTFHRFHTSDEERTWLAGALREPGMDLDSCAILVPTNNLMDSWRKVLGEAGIASCSLLEYAGRPVPGVKVGTYNRAKGLEFKQVFLPNLSSWALRADESNIDDLITRGSQLYVAMTRARDLLRLSHAGEPSLFVEPLLPYLRRDGEQQGSQSH